MEVMGKVVAPPPPHLLGSTPGTPCCSEQKSCVFEKVEFLQHMSFQKAREAVLPQTCSLRRKKIRGLYVTVASHYELCLWYVR